MIIGICPKCNSYKELVTHLFNSKEIPCLCKDCEKENHEETTFEIKVLDLINPKPLTLSL